MALTGISPGMPVQASLAGSGGVSDSAPKASGVRITDSNGGSALVGDQLLGSYTYRDVEGNPEGASTFRWLRNGNAISGATASSYTLVAADSDAMIQFEVTPVASTGASPGNPVVATLAGGGRVSNSTPRASAVAITDSNGGSLIVGDSLVGSYVYNDAEGDVEGASHFRWLRNGTAIMGATGTSYTLVAADSGATIAFEVTPVAVSGASPGQAVQATLVGGGQVSNAAPQVSGVKVTDSNGGSAVAGDKLVGSYTYRDAEHDLEGATSFRWLRNGSAISGATTVNYTLVASDIGQTIKFEVTPLALTGTSPGTAVSAPLAAASQSVNAAPKVSAVSITDSNGGKAEVGDQLVGNYTYSDADNDAEGATRFRWLRNRTPIAGAIASTYTLTEADSGAIIKFEVTPVALTGTSPGIAVQAILSGSGTVSNSPPRASGLKITDSNGGSITTGDRLVGSYTYYDKDGDQEGASRFRWLRNGAAIPGATAPNYTLVAADTGTIIKFEVTPVALTNTSPGTAVQTTLAGGAQVSNSVPRVSGVKITDSNGGSAVTGDLLVGNYSYRDIDGDLEGATTFRWLRNGSAIAGATATSYTLVAADAGQTITFEVTPVALTGASPGLAVQAKFPGAGQPSNSAPVISAATITDKNGGSAMVGDQLIGSFDYHDVDGDPDGGSTFRWLRNGIAIAGETASSYTLSAADSGATITFEVTPVALTGTSPGTPRLASLAGTGKVDNVAPQASAVAITDSNGGRVVVGDQLVGSYTYHDDDGDLEGVTSFRWLRDGVVIAGETGTTHTLVAADSGAMLTFEVTPVATTGAKVGSAVQVTLKESTNRPPVAATDFATTVANVAVTIRNMLTNDSDPEGDPLSIISTDTTSVHGGTITALSNGTYLFAPATNFSGLDSFTYRIDDSNGGSATGTVQITINAPAGVVSLGGAGGGGCSINTTGSHDVDPLLPLLLLIILIIRQRRERCISYDV